MKVVAYEESFGTFTFPEGFEASLKGLSIEQQMDRYRLTMNRLVPCFADEGVCTYYDQENNGAGYKTRIENVYLMCAPEQTGNQGNFV